jgi:glyoxylate reductase
MSDLPRVFVTRRLPAAGLDLILQHCQAEVWPDLLPPPYETIRARIADCAGLVSLLTDRIDAALLDTAPKLKVVSNFAVGFNNIDIPACTARGIVVGNTPGVLTDATADLAFALLMAAARRIVDSWQYAAGNHWKTWEPLGHIGVDLAGKTLGIVGMGRIGTAMARRCRFGWNMSVLYADLNANAQAEKDLGARKVELDELLRESDFISVHTDLNPQTRGLFNAARFRQMKPTAVFINTARGPVVVEADLIAALKAGTIFAAGLDVTDPEPPVPDSELFRTPNLVVVPHIASATKGTRDAMATICARNLLAGLSGKPLTACVNPDVESRRR